MDLTNIKEIHIEPTSLCNAECLQCARNIHGSDLNPYIKLSSLDIKFFESTFNKENLKNINKIFFCGNVGDPCATPEFLEILRYLKSIKNNIILGLNTNGSLKTEQWFRELASILNGQLDYVVFSIDGLADTNQIYRRNTKFEKIIKNAKSYIDAGGSAHWDMLVFDHNKHQVDSCKKLADHLKFNWFRSKQTDRWDTYPMTVIKPAEKYKKIDYSNAKPNCERDRDSSIFLDYTGKWWPCCHMAEAYLNKIGEEKHKDIKLFSNVELFEQYTVKLQQEPFYICRRACGVTSNKRSQWKTEEQLR